MKDLGKIIYKAQVKYLIYNTVPPKQFNLKFDLGGKAIAAEFCSESGNWTDGFVTILSDYEALNFFFSEDADKIKQILLTMSSEYKI